MEYNLSLKEQNNVICSNTMGLESVIVCEMSNKNIIWYSLYMDYLKNGTNKPIYKAQLWDTDVENECVDAKAGKAGVVWMGRL